MAITLASLVSSTALAGTVLDRAGTVSPERVELRVSRVGGREVKVELPFGSIQEVLGRIPVPPGHHLELVGPDRLDIAGFDPRPYRTARVPYQDSALNLVLRAPDGTTRDVHVRFKPSVNLGGETLREMLDGTLYYDPELSDLRAGHRTRLRRLASP